jgi:hypothetical protein
MLVILHAGTPASAACGSGVGRKSAMQRSSSSPLVAEAVLVPAFSAANATVAPVPAAVLITSAVETTDGSPTGVSFALLPNASKPEAFLPFSDVIGGALHTSKRPH